MLSAGKRKMLCLVVSVLFCISPLRLEAAQNKTPQRNRSIQTNEIQARFATLKKLIDQFQKDSNVRRRWQDIATQTFQPEALISASDRDPADIALRRTDVLLAYLKSMPRARDLSVEETLLDQLKKDNNRIPIKDTDARYQFFRQILKLRRKIAFSNPLLDFERILFIKRHFLPATATWGRDMRGNHMCDQYYGFHTIPGGGLFVLENPFGEKPIIRNILADSVCENGRFKGKKLKPGGFLSPELSYDGNTILFAYTEAEPT